ncbi:MAG: MoxR family ATPase [Victivallaceae bacterium]
MNQSNFDVNAVLSTLPDKIYEVRHALANRIFGQDELVEDLLIAIISRGHCIITGVPGLAKTLLISSLSEVAELDYKRIQFTPDMMPGDITGNEILELNQETGRRELRFVKGPVFTQMLLADEINRASPKTQSALLEAMQERSVSVAGRSMKLPEPFFVLATQTPIEQEGTYPLPEAQLDRFMFYLNVDYPSFEDEVKILTKTTSNEEVILPRVINTEEILQYQYAVRAIPMPQSVVDFIAKLVRLTRPDENSPELVKQYIRWGAGPRACQNLALAAKSYAAFAGRKNASIEDVKKAAYPVLRHRLILNFRAESENMSADKLIKELINLVEK